MLSGVAQLLPLRNHILVHLNDFQRVLPPVEALKDAPARGLAQPAAPKWDYP
jgi:hypothetical protein